jgi:hypothetical protein
MPPWTENERRNADKRHPGSLNQEIHTYLFQHHITKLFHARVGHVIAVVVAGLDVLRG